ncbi:MAG: ATP-binding protein, partial [Pseudomonadota bacterium]
EQGVKVCTASVPHRSDDVVRSNPELRGRIAAIDSTPWSEAELRQIAEKGFSRLNVIPDEKEISRLISESLGSPQLMQLLCLNY